jgi:hypothetical protein
VSAKFRKAGRSGATELLAVFVEKPDLTKHAFGLRFNQPSNVRQNFGQRRASKNQFLQLEDRMDRKQTRLVFCRSAQRALLREPAPPSHDFRWAITDYFTE